MENGNYCAIMGVFIGVILGNKGMYNVEIT